MHFHQAPCFLADSKALNCQCLPPRAHTAHYQLSGSAALIIIWPHLFGWLVMIFILYAVPQSGSEYSSCCLKPPLFSKRLFCDNKPPLMRCCLQAASAWTQAISFFFTNHCQLTLKAGKRWHLRFHYRPLMKSTHTNTRQQHVKRSAWQGDKLVITVNFGKKTQITWIWLLV